MTTLLTRVSPSGRKVLEGSMVLFAIMLSGCAAPPIPVNYAPSSVKSMNGSVTVAPFTYHPATPKGSRVVPANVIRNTAIGEIKIDKDVSVFVRDAVYAELRAMGVKMNSPSRMLDGEIQEFLIDDLGYSVDWTLRIKYTLLETDSKNVVFQSVKETKRKTAKGVNVFGALNETMKITAEQLADDPEFIKAIQ